ncbi:MAG TPA: phospholipid carrier-dependent glycosyltransferase [Tahibacter sp.]|uniref:phospholipid carrier-dependent glycosyltransferase n=1 Tax=Tahibacter sp. TaxID=2056211 RepID=UPI002B76E1E5|nr:phospholipid carrier-dependent glycosyltransferase [Tahibacter sp.]HSX62741.1 phospholipid carrier-dependent glycosyltransferase [Tahibacter sp.]
MTATTDGTDTQASAARHGRLADALAPLLLLALSVVTIGARYWEPDSLFWDENYHVTSAQKHLDGVMYMESHPPLGKMLIALGERAVGANDGRDASALLHADRVQQAQLPPGYSFAGVRLASTVSAIATVLLLYAALLFATGQRLLAFVFAALPALDNALVVHARSAMLEGIQLAFAAGAIGALAWSLRAGVRVRLRHYAVLGTLVGLAVAVKLNGAVLLLLPVALFVAEQWPALREARGLAVARRLAGAVPAFCLPLLIVFLGSFYAFIATSTTVVPEHAYKASPEYLQHLRDGTTWTASGFRVGLRDHLRYMAEYADGVPRLDVCKPGENGSHASRWLLGGKTINYRWNRADAGGVNRVSYTYLVANPVVWLSVLAGLALSVSLVVARAAFGLAVADPRAFGWVLLFTSLHLAYLAAILQIERVMYLYHYLLPLLFGIANLAAVWNYLYGAGLAAGQPHPRVNLLLFLLLAAAAFVYFAPLTYGWPLTASAVEHRAWLDAWQLEPVR